MSPTTAADVLADLGDDVDVILDGGPCRVGVESTIVDCSRDEPAILRLGGVPRERIEELLGRRVPLLDAGEVRAPGTLAVALRAPRRGASSPTCASLAALLGDAAPRDERVGVIGAAIRRRTTWSRWASPRDGDEYAHDLYRMLRDADARGLDRVLRGRARPRPVWVRRSPIACAGPAGPR